MRAGQLLRQTIPLRLRRPILDAALKRLDGHGVSAALSYSSTGQDLIIRHIWPGSKTGFYVDVGAWHPKLGSNTYSLYRRGWSGITIEPRRDSTREFRQIRPRDIHLEIGIAPTPGTLHYHVAEGDASPLNSFNADHIQGVGANITAGYLVQVERLDSVLTRLTPSGVTVDLLVVDTEGSDLGVLQSNDWKRFRLSSGNSLG